VVKRRWNDGSVKHAIVSGRATLAANTPLDVVATPTSQQANAGLPRLTAADIQAAAPSAVVQCGSLGVVSLQPLLGNPVRTWVSGPEMVECHYRSDLAVGSLVTVWFHVRLHADGRCWVRAIVENGYLDDGNGAVAAQTDQSYVPDVTIGGRLVFNNGGQVLTHFKYTRWTAEGWTTPTTPVGVTHNVAYLRLSKLVPRYRWTNPSEAMLNRLTTGYTPMAGGDHTPNMSNTGFQSGIGLLPHWDALYCSSGDSRARAACLANAGHLNSYPIVRRSRRTASVVRPSEFPNWTFAGPSGGGASSHASGQLTWDFAHHPSAGFTAYLTTGEYWHLETMALQSSLCYLTIGSTRGSGIQRRLTLQTRGAAWSLRTIGQYCGLAPDEDLAAGGVARDYADLLASTYQWINALKDSPNFSQLGSPWQYELGAWGSAGSVAPWMTDFWVQTNGHISELEPLMDMTALNQARDWMYRWVIGRLGRAGNPGEFAFTRAAQYGLTIAPDNRTDPTNWYRDWGTVFTASFGAANTQAENSLRGTSGAAPSSAATGYWGNLLPALSFAIDHGATGAVEAWARLTNASNWSDVLGSGFDDVPIWGIFPAAFQ
jgi:hypothetical protein